MIIYSTIEKCPLNVFIDVVESGDLKRLLRYRFIPVPAGVIEKAWNKIFYDYLSIIDHEQYIQLLRKEKDLFLLQSKIQLIGMIVNSLSMNYEKGLVEVLQRLGYRYRFDRYGNPDEYIKDVERVKKDVQSMIRTIGEIREEMNEGAKEKIKGSYFDSVLVDLSKFQGYQINKNNLTVSEFANIVKKFKSHGRKQKN